MIDLIKATFIGVTLVVGLLLAPIIVSILGFLLILGAIIGAIWFVLQLLKHEPPNTDPD